MTGCLVCYVMSMKLRLRMSLLCVVFASVGPSACASTGFSKPKSAGVVVADRSLVNETITVACGSCVFGMKVKGCPWAAEVDGHYVLVKGAVPSTAEHDAHAQDGMCNVARKAVVSGDLRGGLLTVTTMKLLPGPEAHKTKSHAHDG